MELTKGFVRLRLRTAHGIGLNAERTEIPLYSSFSLSAQKTKKRKQQNFSMVETRVTVFF